MTRAKRKDIPDPVTNRLYSLSGNRCAFPGCTNPVTYQEAPGREAGDAGAAGTLGWCWQQGPRSKATPLSGDPDAIENLTLLCGVHHPIVDRNPRIYSVEVLAKF
jgi:hypothetical protein